MYLYLYIFTSITLKYLIIVDIFLSKLYHVTYLNIYYSPIHIYILSLLSTPTLILFLLLPIFNLYLTSI